MKRYVDSEINNSLLKMTDKILQQSMTPPQNVTLETNLMEIMDSLDSVELVMAMEKVFDIQIPDDHAEKIFSYDIVNLINIKNELKIYGIFDIQEERKNKLFEIEDKNIMFDWIDDFND